MSDPIVEAITALKLIAEWSYEQATEAQLQDLIGSAHEVANAAHTELFRREETR
jgi:hypothetical protein